MSRDLETVKAMLFDALKASKTKGTGDVYLLDQSNFTSLPKGDPFELWVDDNASFDADKLAQAVLEFFAGREAANSALYGLAQTKAIEARAAIERGDEALFEKLIAESDALYVAAKLAEVGIKDGGE